MRRRLAVLLFGLAFSACSGRRLPPGTPPPEYEPPVVTQWVADAGAVPPDATPGSANSPAAVLGAELSPDAGVR
jgi:hypothetical protein